MAMAKTLPSKFAWLSTELGKGCRCFKGKDWFYDLRWLATNNLVPYDLGARTSSMN